MQLFYVIFVFIFCSGVLNAQEEGSIDKLQNTARRETTGSLQQFIIKISPLELDVQKRLLNSRLMNSYLEYRASTMITSENGWPSESRVEAKKDFWRLEGIASFCEEQMPFEQDSCRRTAAAKLIVEIAPNSEMLEWMRLRDDYEKYSNKKIEDNYIDVFDLDGQIVSYTFEKQPNMYFMGEPIYDYPTYALNVKLSSFNVSRVVIKSDDKIYSGSLRAHINTLKDVVSEWIRFYMVNSTQPDFY